MRIYYAHPMVSYGNGAKDILNAIRAKFPVATIVNPEDYPDHEMNWYLKLVKGCDALMFSRCCDNPCLTSGVGEEIEVARYLGMNIYEFREGELKRFKGKAMVMSREETIEHFRGHKQ